MAGVRSRSRSRAAAAVAVAAAGLAISTTAARLAMNAGEPPATVLPGGQFLAGIGLWTLVAARVAVVVAAWVVAVRWAPRFRYQLLAAAGLFWALWGVWGVWLMLART